MDQVRKRDGRLEPYDETKIVESIHQAASASGIDNKYLARDLAGVVSLYLQKYKGSEIPSSQEIRALLRKILSDTGHAEVARAFEEHRKPSAPPAQADGLFPRPLLVEAHARAEVAPWDRERLAQALRREAGLDDALAGEIAEAVERQALALPQRRVSTALLGEWVNQELVRRGLGGRVAGRLVIGLPKRDLSRLFAGEGAEPGRYPDADLLVRRIGEATLTQYALQEVYPPEVAAAHLEGRIHIHALGHPAKLHALAPDLEDLARRGTALASAQDRADPPREPREVTDLLTTLARRAHGIVAERLDLPRATALYANAPADEARRLAGGLADAAPPGLLRVGIPLDRTSDIRFARAAIEALHPSRFCRPSGLEPVFAVSAETLQDRDCAEGLREACRLALATLSTFVFERPGRRPPPGWRAGAQAVTLNLPQAWMRAGSEPGFFAELEASLELAVVAHTAKRRFLKRFARGEDEALGADEGWTSGGRGVLLWPALRHSLSLCGLAAAARRLAGPDADLAALERAAFRILSFAYAYLKQASDVHRMPLDLEDLPGGEVAARFRRIDLALYPAAWVPPADEYTSGLAGLGDPLRRSARERLPLESRFHSLLPTGTVRLPRSGPASLSPAELFTLLVSAHGETLAAQVATE